MGFLDKIKGATGLGLDAREEYKRAYEKAVFLQPPKYEKAAELFAVARDSFTKGGDLAMAQRASANSLLYKFAAAPTGDILPEISESLRDVPEIERIGSDKEMLPTAPLVAEIEALVVELAAAASRNAAGFQEACQKYLKMGSADLFFVPYLKLSGPTDTSLNRGYFCQAAAYTTEANVLMRESPERACDLYQKAVVAYTQGHAKDYADERQKVLTRARTRRHCWMCGRELQGDATYFFSYPADVTNYHGALLQTLQQDAGMIDIEHQSVVLCSVCGSAVERQADRYAVSRMAELRDELRPVLDRIHDSLNDHQRQINNIVDAINALQKVAHRH